MAVTLARPAALCVPLPKRKKIKHCLHLKLAQAVSVCAERARHFSESVPQRYVTLILIYLTSSEQKWLFGPI
jgi:hypothetical protein